MTDRTRRPATGTATKLLATGASVAAGLGLIGLIDSVAAGGTPVSPAPAMVGAVEVSAVPVTIIRRVVVPTTQPDVLLQMSMGTSKIVVQAAPAPIIRTRAAAPSASAPASAPAPAVAQSTSSGS